ncbi:MAG: PepSY domain-containing protein [Caldilineaceae bacterium]|nr:PepSY domain-containing protein [Caldilineaceae bacterium]
MLSNPATQTNVTADEANRQATTANKFYLATWRWHFYAGIYVVPFLIMLASTGLIMLYQDQIEGLQYGDRLFVTPGETSAPASTQYQAVQAAYPDAAVTQYITPPAANRSSQFAITTAAGQGLMVFVDPYTATVLGDLDRDTTWYTWANTVHGTLLIGDTGDRLIEIAAGFAIMLVITGLYLWWPRERQEVLRAFWPRWRAGKRIVWRDLHSSVGFYASLMIIFFMISGMSWTGIWGTKFVQAWNSFPAEKWGAPLSDQTHAALNHGELEEVPWNLEQTPLPLSGSMVGAPGIPADVPVTLDTVIVYARDNGFTTFRVNLPQSDTGVFTVSADTMSGDITDARQDRTIHLDQYTGKKLADIGWQDYSLIAKGMAAGIALHQGDMGWWNLLLNTLFCLAILLISVSGVVMWWLRRPKRSLRLAAPPMPSNMPLWKGAVVIMLLISLAFPLVGITLLTVLALDLLILSRIPFFKYMFG